MMAVPQAMAKADTTQATNTQPQTVATRPLVDSSFVVPERYAFDNVVVVKVDPAYAEADYVALMLARTQIRQDLGTTWPEESLTLAENKASLVNDLQAFQQRTNFTYHLLDNATGQVIGCLYLSQGGAEQYQATMYFWLIPAYYQSKAYQPIRQGLQQWINTAWPLQAVDVSLNGPAAVKP